MAQVCGELLAVEVFQSRKSGKSLKKLTLHSREDQMVYSGICGAELETEVGQFYAVSVPRDLGFVNGVTRMVSPVRKAS